jgi:predicted ATP-binding protein involved in virulence
LAYAAARRAALNGIHASDIRFVVKDNQLMLLHEGEGWRPFDFLSDGQKRIASIFCELALRCATLNSHLASGCIVDTPGIVTIDELDLHLHPKWQRSLIGDLVRTFPKLQFIAASHSPFLLQAAFEHGKVLDVSRGQFVEPMDRSIEDIAESVMGIPMPQRSRRFLELKAKAQEFYELLEATPVDEQQRAELKARLDEAMVPFANDPAAAAWLDQRRLAAGL